MWRNSRRIHLASPSRSSGVALVSVSEKPIVAFEPSPQQAVESPSAVERIANFRAAARAECLTPEVRRLFKRNIPDSIDRPIAELPGGPFRVQEIDSQPTAHLMNLMGEARPNSGLSDHLPRHIVRFALG